MKDKNLLDYNTETCLVYAARYTHNRYTGATLQVIKAIMHNWPNIRELTKEQIIRESFEATKNKDDWQFLRDFAAKQQ